jgi:4-nitrophenyl phosphatase
VTAGIIEVVRDACGFIFDMDGTIALGDAASGGHKALPYAVELLAALRARGVPFRVFTNGTAKPPASYAASLREAGFTLYDHEMMTPSTSAAIWFVSQGISRVRVLGGDGVAAPLREAGITCIGPCEASQNVEAVYTGWFREFTFPDLEAACQSVWEGAILTTASHVPFFATANGKAIGASFAINKMITSLTGKRPKILGKPSVIAFNAALTGMGLAKSVGRHVVVVGDDPALEMRMAHDAGAISVGLTTGLIERHQRFAPKETPTFLLDSLEQLLRAMVAR